jgi:hypothetical protein
MKLGLLVFAGGVVAGGVALCYLQKKLADRSARRFFEECFGVFCNDNNEGSDNEDSEGECDLESDEPDPDSLL